MNINKRARVLFRCDANADVGMGHLMRCHGLGRGLIREGCDVMMCGPSAALAQHSPGMEYQHWLPREWESIPAEAEHLASLVCAWSIDLVVVDDYRANEEFQRCLHDLGIKQLHFVPPQVTSVYAEVAVCTNPLALLRDYRDVMKVEGGEFLAGPAYAILRDEFDAVDPGRPRQALKNLLITFGGGDDRGAIAFALSTLDDPMFASLKVRVVSGGSNPRNGSNQALADQLKHIQIEYIIQPDSMAVLLCLADLALMAAGTTCYEAARCGVPMLLVSIADNQTSQAEAFERLGCAAYLGTSILLTASVLRSALAALMVNTDELQRMSVAAGKAVDGLGVRRVITAIAGHIGLN